MKGAGDACKIGQINHLYINKSSFLSSDNHLYFLVSTSIFSFILLDFFSVNKYFNREFPSTFSMTSKIQFLWAWGIFKECSE